MGGDTAVCVCVWREEFGTEAPVFTGGSSETFVPIPTASGGIGIPRAAICQEAGWAVAWGPELGQC